MWSNIFKLMALRMMDEFELIRGQSTELRGRAREVLVNRFLEPLLPDTIGLGKGVITSVDKKNTGEIDVILYDKYAFSLFKPFTFYMPEESRQFPAEAVYFVIEVENKLTPKRFAKCIAKIEDAKRLQKKAYYDIAPSTAINMYGKKWRYCPTIGMVFAFNSSNLDDLTTLLKKTNQDRSLDPEYQVDFVCILKKGLIFHKTSEGISLPSPKTQIENNSGKPELNLCRFYELTMHALTQFWTRPIKVLEYYKSYSS